MMEDIRNFLESSTIHGLSYISTTRRNNRLFWTIVVLAGFTGAGVIIYQSFQAWHESPIKTTVESRPITEIMVPTITVCPPKDTFTDLNYDITKTKNITLDNNTKEDLKKFALELLYDQLFYSLMQNLSMLQEKDRFNNWYHGYSSIDLPEYAQNVAMLGTRDLQFLLSTSSPSGTILTRYFGETFDVHKVERRLWVNIQMLPPFNDDMFKMNSSYGNVILNVDIKNISMDHLSTGEDIFYSPLLVNVSQMTQKFTMSQLKNAPPIITLGRKVINEEVRRQKLDLMPGFKVSWMWSYAGKEVKPYDTYGTTTITLMFVRNSG